MKCDQHGCSLIPTAGIPTGLTCPMCQQGSLPTDSILMSEIDRLTKEGEDNHDRAEEIIDAREVEIRRLQMEQQELLSANLRLTNLMGRNIFECIKEQEQTRDKESATNRYNAIEGKFLQSQLTEAQEEINELHRQLGSAVAEETKKLANSMAIQEVENTIAGNVRSRESLEEMERNGRKQGWMNRVDELLRGGTVMKCDKHHWWDEPSKDWANEGRTGGNNEKTQ